MIDHLTAKEIRANCVRSTEVPHVAHVIFVYYDKFEFFHGLLSEVSGLKYGVQCVHRFPPRPTPISGGIGLHR